jgi:hypothetical protein|tara:strand:- start:109 stop:387 length:279 start_codon:yes stop_codon:yes gene_type:complete
MPDWSKPDTLIKAFARKAGLIDLLGEDLYSVLESGEVKQDMPFGVSSKFDLRRQDINLQKKFGEDLMFDVDINKRAPGGYRDILRLGITKKF